uniref:Uncharacterized protein isoform X1 n=1 Tax=Pogona vitticeps TaxID=103695 RepID=A0ABM5FXZ7_9SAUR
MEYKKYMLLATALCLGYICPQSEGRPPYACQCLMDPKDRRNCNYASVGITAEECTANGCCFDATVPDVPWCFVPSGQRASLHYAKKTIEPKARLDCGYQGITRKRCQRIGCCFDPTASGAPVCFHPPVNNVSRQCVMDRSAREDCGYPSITAEECQAKGCCFNSYVVSTRWCFHPLSDPVLGLSTIIEAKTAPPECRCHVDPKARTNCGPPGINAEQCRNNGCCFSSEVPGVPWCFTPSPPQYKKVCPSEVKVRQNCGFPGISADECEKRGCCFESKPPAVPWCFFHTYVEEEC